MAKRLGVSTSRRGERLFWDEPAEQATLGAALMNDSACSLFVREIALGAFYLPRNERIATAIRSLHAEGREVDAVTVAAELEADADDRTYLHACAESVPAVTAMPEYIAIVNANARRRHYVRETRRALEELAQGNGDGEALFREITAAAISKGAAAPPAARAAFLDWPSFWAREQNKAEWAYPDVLALGRGHAMYAVHKSGKSLLTLYIAARLATGREPFAVLYLDYEMSEADLRDRLEDMGYGPDSDLSRLSYALLPTLSELDTAEGAFALKSVLDRVQNTWPDHHLVVIIDTISRAVSGEENSADTFRAFYNHTGMELKRRGCTWLRLDHAGKASGQGQRGSSAKGDDVDLVWKLTRTESGVQLQREAARMSWVPECVNFKMSDCPLEFVRLASDWPEGTEEVADWLDRFGVDIGASISVAVKVLRDHGVSKRKQVVGAALRWRRSREEQVS